MSSFTGKFREYPTISADNFEKNNLSSVAFFLSHCHKDHMSGLDSSAFHQRLMTSKTVFVYCSETTQNLLMCNQSYTHLKEYIRSIPLEQQTMIPLVDENTEEQSSMCVTLLPAGHCVGSVMFLFEGQHGNVLYTGDFRLAKGDVKRIPFFHANGRIKDIKSIYIDTTFCLPKMNFLPSREQSRDAILELIDRWFSRGPEYVVSLLCKGMYGFEYLLKEVAMNYKAKIHVSAERLAMYRYLPDLTPYFTTDGQSTRIHACKWESKRHCESDLPCGLSIQPSLKMKVLRIKPTTMWVARDTEPMPADWKRYDKGKRLWRVVHSMHASMEEIQDLVGYLRPYHVYPNVPPAGLDSLEDAFERLKGLTRLQECDSCNQDESGEERFKQQAACRYAKEEQKQERKLQHITRVAPSQKVQAQCKELGIEEEESLAPVRKRRKAKTANVVMEEKTSILLQQPAEASTSDNQTDFSNTQVEQVQDLCSVMSHNAAPRTGRHTMPLSVLHDNLVSNACKVEYAYNEDSEERNPQIDKTATSTRGALESCNTLPQSSCHSMPLPVLCDDPRKGCDKDYAVMENGDEKQPQFHKTTEVRALDRNKRVYEANNGQIYDPVWSKTKDLDLKCSQNSIEAVMEGRGHVFPENNSEDWDKNTIQSKTKDLDSNVFRGSAEGILPEGDFIDKNAAEKCFSSSERLGLEGHFNQGGMGGGLFGNNVDFDVPPSPGHVEPRPDKLSLIHQLMQNAEPLSITK